MLAWRENLIPIQAGEWSESYKIVLKDSSSK